MQVFAGNSTQGNLVEPYVGLIPYYTTLEVEVEVETYVYDIGSFLASVGGNLGLLLGFSCLTVIFASINIAKKVYEKGISYCHHAEQIWLEVMFIILAQQSSLLIQESKNACTRSWDFIFHTKKLKPRFVLIDFLQKHSRPSPSSFSHASPNSYVSFVN